MKSRHLFDNLVSIPVHVLKYLISENTKFNYRGVFDKWTPPWKFEKNSFKGVKFCFLDWNFGNWFHRIQRSFPPSLSPRNKILGVGVHLRLGATCLNEQYFFSRNWCFENFKRILFSIFYDNISIICQKIVQNRFEWHIDCHNS